MDLLGVFRIELIKIDENALDVVLSRLYEIVKSANLPMPQLNSYIQRGKDILLSRLNSSMWKEATHLYIEEQYNEDAWKDMVSLYYVHTFPHISTRTMRVHLFRWKNDYINISSDGSDIDEAYHYVDESVETGYLGYFNLRPVNNPTSILSYVMPNYRTLHVSSEDKKELEMLTYNRPVHICGVTLRTSVFPFFSGESIVAVCAHCSLIMLSRFIYRKMGFSEIKLKDICAVDRQGIYPSYGLSLKNILEIFINNNVFFRAYTGMETIRNEAENGVYSLPALREIVFSFLDSQIPVLLAFNSHVVLLCGVTTNHPNEERYVAIYDDSGAFISKVAAQDEEYPPYMATITWGQLCDAGLNESKSDMHVIAPMYPRVSLDYPTLEVLLRSDSVLSDSKLSALSDNHRAFLLDCNQTKAVLLQIANTISIDVERIKHPASDRDQNVNLHNALLLAIIEHFLHTDTLHYYWWVEYPPSRTKTYDYIIVNTVKTSSLHITEYCINFVHYDPEVILLAYKHADEGGYREQLKKWLEKLGSYGFILFSTAERVSKWRID